MGTGSQVLEELKMCSGFIVCLNSTRAREPGAQIVTVYWARMAFIRAGGFLLVAYRTSENPRANVTTHAFIQLLLFERRVPGLLKD